MLHGLLGQGRNWRTFAKALARDAPAVSGETWRVLTLDMRCHGESADIPGFDPPHTMESAARDIVHYVKHELGCAPSQPGNVSSINPCGFVTEQSHSRRW